MKKYIATIIILFLFVRLYSQIFAPVGASWYYNKQEMLEFDAHGYTKFTVEKDTVIASKTMQYISAKEYLYDESTKELPDIFIYVQDSQVYKLIDNKLLLVYDFTIKKGDTLSIEIVPDELCDSITPIILDSLGKIILDKDTLMVQYFSYSERYIDGSEFNKINYTVIEKIGNIGEVNDFLKTKQICSIETSQVNVFLRCYNDNDIHFKADWVNDIFECDYLINKVSIPKTKSTNKTNIYPNPVNDKLNIVCDSKEFSLILYDSQGKRIIQKQNTTTLDVNFLSKGLYFLKLYNNNKTIQLFKFVKE